MASPRIAVEVEACLTASSTARPSEVRERLAAALERASAASGGRLAAGAVAPAVLFADDFLSRNVRHARVCDFAGAASDGGRGVDADGSAAFGACDLRV